MFNSNDQDTLVMYKFDELMFKCLELTKTDAYTRNTSMWTQAADNLYNFIKAKTKEEVEAVIKISKQRETEDSMPRSAIGPSDDSGIDSAVNCAIGHAEPHAVVGTKKSTPAV